MQTVYEFSPEEVIELLVKELIRKGKVDPKAHIHVQMQTTSSYGKMDYIKISIGKPIAGAKELRWD